MDLEGNPDRVSHPASAAVQVTDLIWRGYLNPSLLIKDDGELLVDEYLSPRKLKVLTGVDDLLQVKVLEMQVDTRENSLGNLGAYLPNLRELNLNNSLLISVREMLGTSISPKTPPIAKDLKLISHPLQYHMELYIAYNNISDLSQLTWLEHLEVLDLEGNNIEDINQMQYLGLCCKLSHLSVEGNLICLKPTAESTEEPDYNYRAEVKNLIPHLKYLGEIPASQTSLPSKKMRENWQIIKESIKEGGLAGNISWLEPYLGAVAGQPGCSPRLPTTSRPGATQCSANAGPSSSASLLHGGCPLPKPTVSDESEDVYSDLTHGRTQDDERDEAMKCQKLRAHLEKYVETKYRVRDYHFTCTFRTWSSYVWEPHQGPSCQEAKVPAVSPLKPCSSRTENLYGSGGEDLLREDMFSELRVQREQHKRCLQTGQQGKAAQVLKVTLGDEEEGKDCSLTDSCEDKLRESCDEDLIKRISLDSSCQSCVSQSSSGSSQAQEGATSSNLNCCLIPSPPKGPSPASVMGVAAKPWRMRNYRIRTLKIPSQEEDRQWTQ